MKALRLTTYHGRGTSHTVGVTATTPDATREDILLRVTRVDPESLHVCEMFEVSDEASPEQVILEAKRRQAERARVEQHMCTMYFYTANGLRVARRLIVDPQPSPLDPSDARDVLIQLSRHPSYKGQGVVTVTRDRTVLGMLAGKVVTLDAKILEGLDGSDQAAMDAVLEAIVSSARGA